MELITKEASNTWNLRMLTMTHVSHNARRDGGWKSDKHRSIISSGRSRILHDGRMFLMFEEHSVQEVARDSVV